MKRLNCSYFVECYGFGNYEGKDFIQMEYFPHPNLQILIKNESNKSLKIGDITVIMFQILKGLEYLHRKYICHRDITTSNILVSKENLAIKIIDFGLSKVFQEISKKGEINLFEMMSPVGNFDFRAPELKKGKFYNFKVDIWSTGIVLKHLWKSSEIFKKDGESHFDDENKKIDSLETNYKKEITDLINSLLQKDQNLRPNATDALEFPIFTIFSLLILKYTKSTESIDTISRCSLEKEIKKFSDPEIKVSQFSTFQSVSNSEENIPRRKYKEISLEILEEEK